MTEDNHRKALLTEAETLVNGDRNNQYGPPHQDFQRTADILTAMGVRFVPGHGDARAIKAHDVALILAAVKMSRLAWSPEKRDSWVDLAGYAACGHEAYELTHPEDPEPEPEETEPDETGGFKAVRGFYGRRITALFGKDGKRVRYFRSPGDSRNFYRLADGEFTFIEPGDQVRTRSGGRYFPTWDKHEVPVSDVPVWAR